MYTLCTCTVYSHTLYPSYISCNVVHFPILRICLRATTFDRHTNNAPDSHGYRPQERLRSGGRVYAQHQQCLIIERFISSSHS